MPNSSPEKNPPIVADAENGDGESQMAKALANWIAIRNHNLFHQINDEELRSILPLFQEVNLKPNQFLFVEKDDTPDTMYLTLTGNLVVIKEAASRDQTINDWDFGNPFVIARLGDGDTIGELGLFNGGQRSASIRSSTESRLLRMGAAEFKQLETRFPKVANQITRNVLKNVGDKLKQTSANEVAALRVELEHSVLTSKANLFFSYIIALLCGYNLVIQLITGWSLNPTNASIISALIIVVFGSVLVVMIFHSKLPARNYGITLSHWKPALRDAMVWTIVVIFVMVAVKWALIQYVDRFHGLALFDFNVTGKKYLAFNFVLYGLHSPLQEFIARGVLQGSLQHFFKGKHVTLRAIIISNALFSATHVHLLGGLLGLIVFVPGLFWGWLYSRNGNLIGVSLSHLLIGWTGLFFLNLESLF